MFLKRAMEEPGPRYVHVRTSAFKQAFKALQVKLKDTLTYSASIKLI